MFQDENPLIFDVASFNRQYRISNCHIFQRYKKLNSFPPKSLKDIQMNYTVSAYFHKSKHRRIHYYEQQILFEWKNLMEEYFHLSEIITSQTLKLSYLLIYKL